MNNTVKITILGTLPNLNDYTKANRSNKYAGANMKRKAEGRVIEAVNRQADGVRFEGLPVEIHFLWVEPNQRRDLDNIAFAKKFILDGLVKADVLANDNWHCVSGFTDTFAVDKANPRIEVTIKYANDTLPF